MRMSSRVNPSPRRPLRVRTTTLARLLFVLLLVVVAVGLAYFITLGVLHR